MFRKNDLQQLTTGRQYYQERLENEKNKPKETWQILITIIQNKLQTKKTVKIVKIITSTNSTQKEPQVTAD